MIYLLLLTIVVLIIVLYVKQRSHLNEIKLQMVAFNLQQIKLIKENFSYMAKKDQSYFDNLAAQLKAGTDEAIETVKSEAASVKAAINRPDIDTTELEREISRRTELKQAIEDIYEDDTDLPTEELPEPTPSEPQPSEPVDTPEPTPDAEDGEMVSGEEVEEDGTVETPTDSR